MSRRFERGYRVLFGLHAGGLIRLIGVVFMVTVPTVVLTRIGLSLPLAALVSLFYLLVSLILALITVRIVGVGSFKVYYTIVTMVMIESIIVDSVMSLVKGKPIIMAGVLASLVPLSLVVSLLKDPVGARSTASYLMDLLMLLVMVISLQLPIYLIISELSNVGVGIIRVIYLDLALIAVSMIIMLATITVHKVNGTLSYLKLFGAFIYTMMTGDGSFMEFHLLKSSRDSKVNVHVIHIDGKGGEAYIVVPYLHAGPLSHVGGADLIPLMVKAAKSMGTRVVYLHGVGGHEVDPASHDDTIKVVNSVKNAMVKLRSSRHLSVIKAKPIAVVESGDVRLLSLPIADGKNLILVSRLTKSMDDIPMHVYSRVAEELGTDLDRFIIVDSQNGFSSDNTWGEGDIRDLINGLRKIMSLPDVEGELMIKVSHIPRSKIPGSFMEIGDNGVHVVTLSFNGERAAVVVIDGNNIRPDLACEIRRRLSEAGYVAEVVTTDNHQYTGFFGKIGYRVVGDGVNRDRLIKLILNAVSRGNPYVARVSYIKVEENIRTVGSDEFHNMTKAASSAVSLIPLHISLLFLAPLILSIAAVYIILH